jgi:hypothetical protein
MVENQDFFSFSTDSNTSHTVVPQPALAEAETKVEAETKDEYMMQKFLKLQAPKKIWKVVA